MTPAQTINIIFNSNLGIWSGGSREGSERGSGGSGSSKDGWDGPFTLTPPRNAKVIFKCCFHEVGLRAPPTKYRA